jgi:hypothetical protein
VCNDKIQLAEQLKKRKVESAEHIFVNCVSTKFGWSLFRDVLEWPVTPDSLEELHNKLIEGADRENENYSKQLGSSCSQSAASPGHSRTHTSAHLVETAGRASAKTKRR